MTPWSRALEKLLAKANQSKSGFDRDKVVVKESFTKWKTGKRGPSVHILDRLLKAMGLTWHDWAEAYEGTDCNRAQPTRQVAGQAKRVEVTFEDESERELSPADIRREFTALKDNEFKISDTLHAHGTIIADLTTKVDSMVKLLKRGKTRSA